MFKALDFYYENSFLSEFGMFIQTINVKNSHDLGGSVKVYQEQLYKKNRPLFQGASFQGQKRFNVRIGKRNENNRLVSLEQMEVDNLCSWLEGGLLYKRIDFIQDDLSNIHFNVIIENIVVEYIANNPAYLTLSMLCEDSYGWENERSYSLNTGENKHYCNSTQSGYIEPVLKFKIKTTDEIEISNRSVMGSSVKVKGISNEIITMDNYNKVISSNQGRTIGNDFNYKWLNLIKGNNVIIVKGNAEDITIEYKNARSVL